MLILSQPQHNTELKMPPTGATANQSKQATQNLASLGRQLRLVLLDRDGVVNVDRKSFVKTADQWHPIPGAISAIAALQKNFAVAICSNQSGIGRGLFAFPLSRPAIG